jgi:dienelactone hydrolase
VTVSGSFVGTPRYMSPEQISGGHQQVDHRCDIYALGVTLYELLTLEPLFEGATQHQIISQILLKEPRRPRQINRHIPVDLETICRKAIEKDAERRYRSAGEMAGDLRRFLGGRVITAKPPDLFDRTAKFVRRRTAAAVLMAVIIVLTTLVGTIGWKHYLTRWASQYAVAQIDELLEEDRYLEAFLLARKAKRHVPDNPLLDQRWPLMSRQFVITTSPPDAKVFFSEYSQEGPHWHYLGRSPLQQTRIPFGTHRWRVQKAGFISLEVVLTNDLPWPVADRAGLAPKHQEFTLRRTGDCPADMVWIPPTALKQELLYHGNRTITGAPAYLIDKCEVTNSEYKAFVSSGGYEDPKYWQEPFVRDGQTVSFSEAMAAFRDRTGQAGPATWRHGTYPRGRGRYPVGGLSWYEAAAYARFRDKDLPTIFHWTHAARADDEPYRITHLSNFGERPAAVGRYKGMGRFGLYDAAGNVREWCHNAVEGQEDVRCILGGTWNELETAFINGAYRCPWDRDPANGLRCVKYPGGREMVPAAALDPVECKSRDFESFEPISDATFRSYMDTWYRYDQTPLNARVELVDDDLGYCWRERITFDAAYPNERVTAYLHLPEDVTPPYQIVVWYPTGMARFSPWDERAYTHELVCIIRSGRAVLVPFYKGTYDRRLEQPTYAPDGIQSRNLYIQRSQDLRRSIDYLETRKDIDLERLAYVGLAWGGQMGPVMIAPEKRFKAAIFLLGGICACPRHPASDPANFARRVEIPTLMLNGREDSLFPYETAQRPLFRLLGTPEPHKRHTLFPGEHCIPWEYREQYHQEIVKWLDEYLGPVRRTDDKKTGEAGIDVAASSESPGS